ncbi:hypothetical protein ACFQ3P_20775 [Paraburkholderia sabiae]|uniref:Lipoprotein n=1 Tax=Paraburkholderia sabiae TaxID=273251 RepID=A0ABU9QJT5_9BURK|nr:hypothetical protein [Paraburkholderia sabiae]WJZ73469.1 hypothetical protein QEN71_25560 [Paraburkholderia sabiae]CAD6542307.1 hypothetical protein LMG24235_03773 [Paraburkholderia sabiae]
MKTSLVVHLGAAVFALPLSSIAAEPSAPFSMAGVSDRGETVELRFDAPSARTARLLIKGDRTGATAKTVPCSYEIEPVQKSGTLDNPVIQIRFADNQKLTIACDPLSDNCHADGYPTVSGTTFSLLWRIQRADPQSVHAKGLARK